jgi:hypothetical protein
MEARQRTVMVFFIRISRLEYHIYPRTPSRSLLLSLSLVSLLTVLSPAMIFPAAGLPPAREVATNPSARQQAVSPTDETCFKILF